MNYKCQCLYCGEPGGSVNYSCNCEKSGWASQYRMLDIDMELEFNRKIIADSFQRYSFNHPEGMLQYRGLPLRYILARVSTPLGLSPLHKLAHLSEEHGCNIFLKDEGANPSGCFKDRETVMCLLNSIHQNLNKAAIYSSGNAAASAAYFAERSGHQVTAFVAGDTYPEKIDYIKNHGADVVCIGDESTNFEAGYRLFSEIAENEIFARHGYDNWSVRNPFRVQGDKTIAVEIVKQLSRNKQQPVVPAYVVVPTANGSCLAGIWKGFKELCFAGLISTLPKMIAVGIEGASAVSKAVRLQRIREPVRCNLSQADARDLEAGSTIVAEEGYDSVEAARAVINSGGFEVEVHTKDIKEALIRYLQLEDKVARKHQLLPEPAALTSLAAINQLKTEAPLASSDVVVAISTGDGRKAGSELENLLENHHNLRRMMNNIIHQNQEKKQSTTQPGRVLHVKPHLDAIIQSFLQFQKQTHDA